MMTHTEVKQDYLRSLDVLLEPRSFRRRRHTQEWRHKIDDASELWIHINFGKTIDNPSLGVKYLDFDSILSRDVSAVSGTMTMLRSLLPTDDFYMIDEGPARVARDLLKTGIPFLFRLTDRTIVIELLKSGATSDWPSPSYSDRIRLLPLLLASEGRIAEAREYLSTFQVESSTRDQIIPGYDVFAAAFRQRFAC